jgi:hypothetical protein
VGLLKDKSDEARRSGWYRTSDHKMWIVGDQRLTFNSYRISSESGWSSGGFIFYSMGGGHRVVRRCSEYKVARKVISWYISLKIRQNTHTMSSRYWWTWNADDVFNSHGHRPIGEENEGVALAGRVALGNEKSLHDRSVGYNVFELAVDGI